MSSAPPRRSNLSIWALCCVGAAAVMLVYLAASRAAGGASDPLMPLDDAYIHFQYARQIAAGQFYVYNPGLPPTSGATSFIYPYLLAFGHGLGFHGLSLGMWALGMGALALAGSAYAAFRLAVACGVPLGISAVMAGVFILHGWTAWHFMSGMETGFAILFTLLTAWGMMERRHRLALLAGALLAVTRPEGAILALAAAAATVVRERRISPLLLLPMLAVGVQPVVNWVVTGSAVASGNSAKSLFGMIPFDFGVVIGRIAENFARLWRDLAADPALGMGSFTIGALIGLMALAARRKTRADALLLIGWGLAFALAVSTLDTAFWHFRRYQLPLFAVVFPLAAIGYTATARLIRLERIALPVLMVLGVAALPTATEMMRAYVVNVGYVRAQPLALAGWLRANTPPDAAIAVHDVGMMRYMGERTTLDMVGLTTPGAAEYWRGGPGAVGEWIERQRPDYIASYGVGHGLGLGYLENTPLYGQALAVFPVSLDPAINVALAADRQGVYRPDYHPADLGLVPGALPALYGFDVSTPIDQIDVADIVSEREHAYSWSNRRPAGGFPSEYYAFPTIGCRQNGACLVMDGGRRINGDESFSLHLLPGRAALLITRLHAADLGEFDVFVGDEYIATRTIPALPGAFLEVGTYIPAAMIAAEPVPIRIVPRTGGDYMPYMHWAYQEVELPALPDDLPAVVYQDGALAVYAPSVRHEAGAGGVRLTIDMYLGTRGGATGDYKLFIHIVNEQDEIAAQIDGYPGDGALPPGNWLPGRLAQTLIIDADLPPARYRVVMGFYNPITFERLTPQTAGGTLTGDDQSRFMLGEVMIAPTG